MCVRQCVPVIKATGFEDRSFVFKIYSVMYKCKALGKLLVLYNKQFSHKMGILKVLL